MIPYDYAAALALGSVAAEAEVETRRVDVGNRQPSRGGLLVRRSWAGEHAVRGSAERLRVAVDGDQPERPRIPDLLRPHADLALNENPAAAIVARSVGPAVKSDQRRCASGSSEARWRDHRERPPWLK